MERLPFSPRRFTNRDRDCAGAAARETAPGDLDKVLFAPSGAAAISHGAETRPLRDRPAQDAVDVGFLPRRQPRRDLGRRRSVVPPRTRADDAGAEHVPPLNLAARFFGDDRPFERLADYIDYVLAVEGDVAALIAEPMRWTTVEPPPPDFWPRVGELLPAHGTLLIFDEIPSCLARTGAMFACEHFGATPDILVIGKGLGGGIMPMAAIMPGPSRCAPDAALGHYTHEKSPVACAAALATLDVIEEESWSSGRRELGGEGLDRLAAMQAPPCGHPRSRGLGLYFGVEIGGDEPAANRAERLLYRCLASAASASRSAAATS